MSRRKKSCGGQGSQGSLVLYFLFDSGRRLRNFQPDLAAHHPRTRGTSRTRAVRSKEAPPGIRRDESGKQIAGPCAAEKTLSMKFEIRNNIESSKSKNVQRTEAVSFPSFPHASSGI